MTNSRFPPEYRLKRRQLIGALFSKPGGHNNSNSKPDPAQRLAEISKTRTTAHGAVRILYRLSDRESSGSTVSYQVAFAVPKRVRKAVDRNRLKRLLRVAFQQKKPLFDVLPIPDDRFLSLMILFRADGRSVEKQVTGDTEIALDKLAQQMRNEFAAPDGSDGFNAKQT